MQGGEYTVIVIFSEKKYYHPSIKIKCMELNTEVNVYFPCPLNVDLNQCLHM